ncbi:MAG: metallopeptidase family protein [Alphaproteobacteria bacterium]
MEQKRIIMNYTVPPSISDFEEMAGELVRDLPDELSDYTGDLVVQVEDFPDDATQSDHELDDAYELLGLYRGGNEVAPGVEKKISKDEDVLTLYRRPILDVWCENGEDLSAILREVMIEEIAKAHDFSGDEIDEMSARHYQGML